MRPQPRRKLKCLTLKVGYKSRDEARSAAHGLLPFSHTGALRVYKCKQCGEWHLTSQLPEGGKDGRWKAVARG